MAFLDFLLGQQEKTKQFQQYTPQQQQALGQLLSGGQQQLPQAFDFLSQLLTPGSEALQAYSVPAMRAFEQQTIPTIAERFTGMNAQKSSAFGQQLGQAGAGLQENLAAQRAALGMQGISQLQNLLQGGLTPQFQSIFSPATQGLLGGLIPGFGQSIGMLSSPLLQKLLGM
jgi:hypothetical protein